MTQRGRDEVQRRIEFVARRFPRERAIPLIAELIEERPATIADIDRLRRAEEPDRRVVPGQGAPVS